MTTGSFVYAIDDAGAAERLPLATRSGDVDCALLWRHVDGNEPGFETWLADLAEFDGPVLEALKASETRARASKIGNGALVTLRGVNQNPDADPDDLVSVRLWVTARAVLSINFRPLLAIGDMEAVVRSGAVRDAGDFIVELAGVLTMRLDDVLDDLSRDLDVLEEDVIAEHGTDLRERIGKVRRTAIGLRRFISPQREALSQLASGPYGFFDESDRQYLAEAAQGVTRIIEEIDAIRDQAAVLSDQLSDIRAEAVGKRTLVLSIVSAIFLPLSYLAGLIGMNVAGIPFADEPWAFAAIFAANIALGAAVVVFLRTRGWFG
jgi:zinc transporter